MLLVLLEVRVGTLGSKVKSAGVLQSEGACTLLSSPERTSQRMEGMNDVSLLLYSLSRPRARRNHRTPPPPMPARYTVHYDSLDSAMSGSIESIDGSEQAMRFQPHSFFDESDREQLVRTLFELVNESYLEDDGFFIRCARLGEPREIAHLMTMGTFVVVYRSSDESRPLERDDRSLAGKQIVCCLFVKQQSGISHPQHKKKHATGTEVLDTAASKRFYLGLLAVLPSMKRRGLAQYAAASSNEQRPTSVLMFTSLMCVGNRIMISAGELQGQLERCESIDVYVVSPKPWLQQFYAARGYEFSGLTAPFDDREIPHLLFEANLLHMSKPIDQQQS